MIFLLYIIFFFLILRFTVTLFNFISNPKLGVSVKQYHQLVSILIPEIKNEKSILGLIYSIQNQEYTNIEVLIWNNNNSEVITNFLDKLAEEDHRFQIISGPEKQRNEQVCHQLAKNAKGTYFLFLDSELILGASLINNAVHRMQVYKLSLLSLFSQQIMDSFILKIVLPMRHYMVLNLLPLRLVSLTKAPVFSVSNKQFLMFDALAYQQNKWHKSLQNTKQSFDLMKLLKQQNFKVETLLANNFLASQTHESISSVLNDMSETALRIFGNSIIAFLGYILLTVLLPLYVLIFFNVQLFVFYYTLVLLSRLMISFLSEEKAIINIFLHPIQILSLILVFLNSCIYKNKQVKNI